jgi:multidrug efflux pump
MRRSLGTAVFSGMLGVTLFGIFLTPVFFYVLQWFGRPPAPAEQRPAPPRPPQTGIQERPDLPRP